MSIFNSALMTAHYAAAAGFTGDALVTAVAVAGAESAFDPAAMGDKDNPWEGCRSIGLWQISVCPNRDESNPNRQPDQLTDPVGNARAAFGISSGGTNWSPWSAYTNGSYRRFLPDAEAAVAKLDPTIVARLAAGEDAPKGRLPFDLNLGGNARGAVNAVTGAVTGAVNAVTGAVGAVTDPLASLARLAAALMNPRTWGRVLFAIAGLVALIAAAGLIAADTRGVIPS